MVDYIDRHRDEFGVEPICRTLQFAPSSYDAAKARPPSARQVRDAKMGPVVRQLWVDNRKVYGAHKLWKAARRQGHDIGRDQVARLMRQMGIYGVSRRRKKVFTTVQDPDASRAPDLVNRDFTADQPDALWVTDLTYVPTRSGMAYVCFIVDAYSRRIVGWRVASNMKTEMVLDALEMARRSRGARQLVGLITHADAGSQFTSVRFTERLEEIGARPSIGTVADSYDTQSHFGGGRGGRRSGSSYDRRSDPSYDWRCQRPEQVLGCVAARRSDSAYDWRFCHCVDLSTAAPPRPPLELLVTR